MMRPDRLRYVRQWLFFAGVAGLVMQAQQARAEARTETRDWCTCVGGGVIETGAVRYEENSHRQTITRVEVKHWDGRRRCAAVWVGFTQIRPYGDPYSFHLKRTKLREQREEGCGDAPTRFLRRAKTYQFSFDADSRSIREMDPVFPENDSQQLAREASAKSNANLWDAISPEDPIEPEKRPAPQSRPAPEFRRTAWVVARKEITGHYISLVQGADRKENVVPLNNTRTIKAGQVGQIEASNGRTAIVRFYAGSNRTGKFAGTKNAFRRWYDDIGGPYTEAKDELYSPVRACIVEVSLEDIVEINDYFDRQNTDRT